MSADLARRAFMALSADLPLPPDVCSWLQDALSAYLEQGQPIHSSLGLTVAPGRFYDQPHVARRLESRDSAIRAIKYWTFSDLSEWQAAGGIVELMRVYSSGDPLGLPKGHPAETLLAKLADWPLSRKQIYRILRGDRSC